MNENAKNFIQGLLELWENTGTTEDCQAVNETLEGRMIVEDYTYYGDGLEDVEL